MAKRSRLTKLVQALLAAAVLAPCAAHASGVAGDWQPLFHEDQPERVPGPSAGDYAGLPITETARSRGDTWNGSLLTMPERQCVPHPAPYEVRSVGWLRVWENRNPDTTELISIETQQGAYTSRRHIWMDGRAPPPEWALHTWGGFSSGHFEGDVLVVKTINMKQSFVRRNGLPMSDKAVLTERWMRHGDYLLYVSMLEDPIYLTEPFIHSTHYRINLNQQPRAYPCRPAVEVPRESGVVPHEAFKNDGASEEYAKTYGLPLSGVRGGANTALPEFMDTFPHGPPAPFVRAQ